MAAAVRISVLVAFGAAVRRLRTARGLSQEGLAELAGVHRTYVGGIERGERNVSLLSIDRLAVALSVPPSALMAEAERGRGRRTRS
jgi:transcriptional regulator with XRE-family HTH domain